MKIILTGQTPAQKNSKKISCRGGRPVMYTLSSVADWQKDCSYQLMASPKLKGQVAVDITIYNKDNRRRDLDNQITSILDALVKAKIIEDDSCKIVTELHAYFGGVDTNARAEIQIDSVGETK